MHRELFFTGLLLCLTVGGIQVQRARHGSHSTEEPQGCGYDACDLGREGFLNVHLIAHTHDDVGWLKTVDQYYYGAQNYIQRAGVQYILDSVIQALAAEPTRRFTYVEMAFFMRWWNAQTLKTQQLVHRLVKTGQLQFALAGWSMADEATVHYTDAIDQMTRGHDALRRIFGDCGIPRVSWQIDPFGHSRDHAELFRDAGLDAVFFQRMDYREKDYRRESKSLEVLWETDVHPNASSHGLFTSMFYDTYCYPATFCFDDKCNDDPIRDDPEMEGYNVQQRVAQFLGYVNKVRQAFATNHIMVLMGCDFTYENANINFKNTDKLIQYVNREQSRGSDVNLLYSTPQCYTKAVNEAFGKKQTIERRRGDFFPYASGPNSYWTGYYTSRPALKRFVREASNLLTMTEQLHLFANRIVQHPGQRQCTSGDYLVDKLRRAMGVMQHHDAVTGTEKEHVAHDYARILSDGVLSSQTLIVKSMVKLMPNLLNLTTGHRPLFCDQLNISICEALEAREPYLNASGNGGVYILVFNPTGWNIWSSWIRLPIYIAEQKLERVEIQLQDLRTTERRSLPYQLIPISQRILNIPERLVTRSVNNMELVFNAASAGPPLTPVGFSAYYLALSERKSFQAPHANLQRRPRTTGCSGLPKISHTMRFDLHVEPSGPTPVTIMAEHIASGAKLNITMQMLYYYGETYGSQSSGAYVFLPKSRGFIQTFPDPKVNINYGSCVEEVQLEYSPWASLTLRHYSNGELEVDWVAGPIPDEWYQFSRELIIRYQVTGDGIKSSVPGEFFTDSAGRRLIRRLRNQRPDWNISHVFRETQPVAGNYYPIISRIVLKGAEQSKWGWDRYTNSQPAMGFAVYTDRAQGGTSLHDGEVELMIHRRLVKDDGYGVGEPLVEDGIDRKGLIVRGKHHLRLDELAVIEKEDQITATILARQPKTLFMRTIKTPDLHAAIEWSALNQEFPPHVHLLSLISWPINRETAEPTDPEQILIRLEHIGSGETFKPERITMTTRLRGIRITAAREVTLTAEQDIQVARARRLQWPTEQVFWPPYSSKVFKNRYSGDVVITLPPGYISTFILDYEPYQQ